MRIYAPSRMQSVKDLPGQTKLKFRCARCTTCAGCGKLGSSHRLLEPWLAALLAARELPRPCAPASQPAQQLQLQRPSRLARAALLPPPWWPPYAPAPARAARPGNAAGSRGRTQRTSCGRGTCVPSWRKRSASTF